jgi:predicted TIM-barrel fold metal-dependent hydrolase
MKEEHSEARRSGRGVSRRGFLKAGLAGAAALSFAGPKTDARADDSAKTGRNRAGRGLVIDAFCHVLPPKYSEALAKRSKVPPEVFLTGRYGLPAMPAMYDAEARLRIMDRYEGYVQILNISLPPPEDVLSPKDAVEVCKIANDSLAQLVYKYPDRFVAATACLPLNYMDAAIKELDRAILDLRLKGVQITTTIMDKPLDSPEFQPLFAKMNHYKLPIQLHPRTMLKGPRVLNSRPPVADPIENSAESGLNWPYETSVAMGRCVFSGMMEKYPNIKILTHHLGGFIPYHVERQLHFNNNATHRFAGKQKFFTRSLLDYYKMFYGDTACYGATPTLMCGYAFFGADHMLFGTDFPYDATGGDQFIRETIGSVEEMDISHEEKKKIYEDNARSLFRLPV